MSDLFGGPPDDEGFDPYGYPEDYPEVEDRYGFFHGDVPEPWWYDDVTIQNEFGRDITLPASTWYEATIADEEVTQMLYGMDPIDIIYELEDLELWDSDDWEVWREFYREQ